MARGPTRYCECLYKLNRNFTLNLLLAGFSGLAESIYSGTMGVAFMYEVFGGSNTKVGIAEALSGLTSLLLALPAGWAADKYSRSKVRVCACI
jgi:MFS family permease